MTDHNTQALRRAAAAGDAEAEEAAQAAACRAGEHAPRSSWIPPTEVADCPTCKGYGSIRPHGRFARVVRCLTCRGDGEYLRVLNGPLKCPWCRQSMDEGSS